MYFSHQKVQESAGDSNFFLIYFAVLSLALKLKQNVEAQLYPEKNSQPPNRVELLLSSTGKIICALYPLARSPYAFADVYNNIALQVWSFTKSLVYV